MHEFAIFPQYARVNQHVLDGAVLASHSRRIVVQLLSRQEPMQDVVNNVTVNVEFCDVMAYIFVGGVAE